MSNNTLRIRRRDGSGAVGAPASLANAELAYNEADDTLYYGKGTGGAGGSATTIVAVGGPGKYALLASPAFTGTPTAPTAAVSTNNTQIATTAFVVTAVADAISAGISFEADTANILMAGAVSVGVLTTVARADHRHPSDTTKANLASPTFTGDPLAPTQAVDNNTTRLATTAFVVGQASGTTPLALNTTAFGVTGSSLRYAREDHRHRMPTLSDILSPDGDVDMDGFRLFDLGSPANPDDAATKGYVDSLVQGLAPKGSVRAASTGNIPTLSGTGGIDGVGITAGQRVLVKDQNTASQNGIYVAAAGAWTRAIDMDIWDEVPAAYVLVEEGTVNANTAWLCTSNQGGTLGTTAITFVKFSGSGQIVAGDGLTLTGDTLAVGTASSARIVVNATNIDLADIDSIGTYRSVTVDTYGRVTAGSNPTTLAGYGITDALSNSTASVQNGYFSDIFLRDDTNPSHYMGITCANDLTANRTLNINPNNADRTISLSGNLTVSAAATVSGTNTGNQTITLTGDVTGTGTGSFAATIANNAVTNAKIADGVVALAKLAPMVPNIFIGRVTTGVGDPEYLTATQARTILNVADGATANVGTVTSVGVTSGTGIGISGSASPITSSGSFTITNTAPNATHTGDVTGSGALTLAASGVDPGTYNNVATQVRPFTVDAKGRLTGIGTAVTITPAWASITSKPTTLAGFGITDAQPLSSRLSDIADVSIGTGVRLIPSWVQNAWSPWYPSSVGTSLVEAANAGAARTVLELGTMATQNATAVNITGGLIFETSIDECVLDICSINNSSLHSCVIDGGTF